MVLQESQVYSSKLRAVDSFCDEITTCYLRTGAGGGGDGGGDGDGEGDGDGDGDGDGGGEADGDADGGNGAGSPNGGRRRSSFDGSDNGAGEEGGSPGMGDTGNNGSGPMSESTSGDTIPKLKPHNMRALDNLKVIEQHVKNVIRQYAAQAMTIGQPGPGGQNTSLASSANLLSSPHGHTGTINYSRLSPKEREAIIAKRIGQVSATTAARSVDQRIPRVDVPDDMEGAFGFDPDGLDEKPLLVHEVSEQLQMQLAKIKEESSLRMSMSSALGSSGTPQQSAVSSTGLIDKASRLRAEKVSFLDIVCFISIASFCCCRCSRARVVLCLLLLWNEILTFWLLLPLMLFTRILPGGHVRAGRDPGHRRAAKAPRGGQALGGDADQVDGGAAGQGKEALAELEAIQGETLCAQRRDCVRGEAHDSAFTQQQHFRSSA